MKKLAVIDVNSIRFKIPVVSGQKFFKNAKKTRSLTSRVGKVEINNRKTMHIRLILDKYTDRQTKG